MDLLLALAASVGAHVAIANDPDADRLGAAIPQPDGSWRRLGGDEIGWLFADYLLSQGTGDDRLRTKADFVYSFAPRMQLGLTSAVGAMPTDDFAVNAMAAVGRPGPKEDLPPQHLSREFPSQRTPVRDRGTTMTPLHAATADATRVVDEHATRASTALQHNLPAQLTSFVARETEVAGACADAAAETPGPPWSFRLARSC